MRDPLSPVLTRFFAVRGVEEIHALRISNGPKAGWTTRIRILIPEAPASAAVPPGFLGEEIAAGPEGADLRTALTPLLPEGQGAGTRAIIASRGAWLLLDRHTPRLEALDPDAPLPRIDASPAFQRALAEAVLPEGQWHASPGGSAHARLNAEAALAAIRACLPDGSSLPKTGILHILSDGRVRALLHAPPGGTIPLYILAMTYTA
jgi:hypothetical protein